jgi:hypothetical protein
LQKNILPVLMLTVVIPAAMFKAVAWESHLNDEHRNTLRRTFWLDGVFSLKEVAKDYPPRQ